MALHLTPDILERTYELLRATAPFKRWRLPHADDVEFRVSHHDSHGADYFLKANGQHVIRMNNNWTGTLALLERRMAHEMVHMHLQIVCPSDQAKHGWRFHRIAAQVCRHHVFDPKSF